MVIERDGIVLWRVFDAGSGFDGEVEELETRLNN